MDESLPGRRAISPVELLVHGGGGGGCVQSGGGGCVQSGGGGVRGGGGSNIVSIAIATICTFLFHFIIALFINIHKRSILNLQTKSIA